MSAAETVNVWPPTELVSERLAVRHVSGADGEADVVLVGAPVVGGHLLAEQVDRAVERRPDRRSPAPATSTTCTVWVTTVSLPALSRAVTVSVREPTVLVSSADPSGTLPTHEARPEPPSSEQLKSTVTAAPSGTWAPSAGPRSMVGAVSSGGAQPAVPVSAIR